MTATVNMKGIGDITKTAWRDIAFSNDQTRFASQKTL